MVSIRGLANHRAWWNFLYSFTTPMPRVPFCPFFKISNFLCKIWFFSKNTLNFLVPILSLADHRSLVEFFVQLHYTNAQGYFLPIFLNLQFFVQNSIFQQKHLQFFSYYLRPGQSSQLGEVFLYIFTMPMPRGTLYFLSVFFFQKFNFSCKIGSFSKNT